jgi:hypothetical protein
MRLVAILSAILVFGVLCVAGSKMAFAQACGFPEGPWTGAMPIKWKLNNNFVGPDSLCDYSSCNNNDVSDVRWTITAALNDYYVATGGKVRFEFAGYTDDPPGATVNDHVHVLPGTRALRSREGGTSGIRAFRGGRASASSDLRCGHAFDCLRPHQHPRRRQLPYCLDQRSELEATYGLDPVSRQWRSP